MELLTGITATLELPSILGSGSNLPRPRVLAAYNNVDWVLFPHYTAAGSQQYGVLQCAPEERRRDNSHSASAFTACHKINDCCLIEKSVQLVRLPLTLQF